MSIKSIYQLSLSALTPLHIGNGETLEKDFDYAVHQGRTWVLDAEQIAALYLFDENGRYRDNLEATPPARLLQPGDFHPDNELFYYVMRGAPRAGRTGAAVQAHIKDVFHRPYLPGSSLKGALRTLFVREAFAGGGNLNPAELNRRRSWAAQNLERRLLGKDPNHDLLRALQVSDSRPFPAGTLRLFNVQVFGQHGGGSPIALECVPGDATCTTTLTVDDYLLTHPEAQRELDTPPAQRQWLTDLKTALPQMANAQAKVRIQQEASFYQTRRREGAAKFYRQLAGLVDQLPSDTFLLQVGWGGGWDSKTLGPALPAATREALVERYNLSRGRRRSGELFPKSRRAVARGDGRDPEAAAPMGWLVVKIEKDKG